MATSNSSFLFTSQLSQLGLSPHGIRTQVASGALIALRRGAYGLSHLSDDVARHRALIAASVDMIDSTSVVAYESAAVLHGLPLPTLPAQATMIRRSAGHAKATRRLNVRDTRLDDADIVQIDEMPVTSLARTAVDLARRLSFEWAVAVCDAALAKGARRRDLSEALTRQHRLRGVPQARRAVSFAEDQSESPAESISRVNMTYAGIPEPLIQRDVFDTNGELVGRVDFLWEEERLVGEVDGAFKYGRLLQPGDTPQAAIMREKRREERIRAAGYWIVRWDWATANDPRLLGERIGPVLMRQRRLYGEQRSR